MKTLVRCALITGIVIGLAAPLPALARDEIRQETIHFQKGTSGATVSGTIKGYDVVDYRLRAAAGQTMRVGITGAAGGAAHGAAPGGAPGGAYAGDAKVAGTGFHATGTIPCARHRGQPMNQCQFGVTREGTGKGMITVTWPDGGNRVIFYGNNTPSSYDQSEADGGAPMTVNRESELYTIRIGDQRFEIPEALMTGG